MESSPEGARGPIAVGGVERMLTDIRSEVALTRRLTGKAALEPRVMSAIAAVPRDAFVPSGMRHAAYDNGPLPIGQGQTISQPFIVALMTDLVEPQPGDRVLEIGTGSGYQAAVLSLLSEEVYSVDRVPALSTAAARRLEALGYRNVQTMVGNGYLGWPEHAPFDAIVVTAAATQIPAELVNQLRPGGRMVIPVGAPHGVQTLLLGEKNQAGQTEFDAVLDVAFVPMVDRAAGSG